MPAFKISYTHRSLKDIEKLDSVQKKRIGKALLKLQKDPFKYSRKLVDSDLGGYRFRVGDFRIIFDLSDHKIIVLRIGHRRGIYN